MADLTQQQWWEQLKKDDNSKILDVRSEIELEECGYIPAAENIDFYDRLKFMDFVRALEPSKNYYVYCKSGGRSAQACAIMNSIGIENAYNLLGGFSKWEGDKEEL